MTQNKVKKVEVNKDVRFGASFPYFALIVQRGWVDCVVSLHRLAFIVKNGAFSLL